MDSDSAGKISGVYVIWYDEFYINTVYVGQGAIADRIAKHQKDPEIQNYSNTYKLYFTCAEVAKEYRDGVERYLADELEPLVGKRHPDAHPIRVNLNFYLNHRST